MHIHAFLGVYLPHGLLLLLGMLRRRCRPHHAQEEIENMQERTVPKSEQRCASRGDGCRAFRRWDGAMLKRDTAESPESDRAYEESVNSFFVCDVGSYIE